MSKLFTKITLAAAAIVALPAAAQAGTSTAAGTASLTVLNQCSVTGASVNLGTYTANQTWADVGAVLGNVDYMFNFNTGSLGAQYVNWGSVICDSGTPYTLSIKGTHPSGSGIGILHNGKMGWFIPTLKKLGSSTVADRYATYAGVGHPFIDAGEGLEFSGVGTGSAQVMLGSAFLHFPSGEWNKAAPDDTLGVAGVTTDTVTYTLNF